MKTIKVSEATGPALDWLVAKCGGAHPQISYPDKRLFGAIGDTFDYSTDWAQGGPIIEEEEIGVQVEYTEGEATGWVADSMRYGEDDFDEDSDTSRFGPTPLIAAMRCYVASKLGNTAEVPEELA